MLSFVRRLINSKVGYVITFGILGVIALAFAAGDITGIAGAGGGVLGGDAVAVVDGKSIASADLRKRVQDELRVARQQQPDVTVEQLVNAGGVEGLLERMVTGAALENFGRDQGLAVSRALVGSELRNIPAFRGPTGQFDQAAYERIIGQQGLTDAQVQRDIARETMTQFLIVPTIGATQVPQQVALPYASLLLERRSGQVALVPFAAVPAGPAPTDAEIGQFYQRNVARYTVPERRVMRYATVTPESVKAQAAPTDAEIRKAYEADRAAYAARETRDVTLVTVLDQNAANALAAKVKGGTALDAAARAAGLEPRKVERADKAALAQTAGAAVADAAFGAGRGAVVGPVRGAIGFVVARVEAIAQVPGKSLDQARAELATKVSNEKAAAALQRTRDAVEDALADNASIAEVVADQKLTAQATPALLANGTDPEKPGVAADPALAAIVAAGFAAEEGDTPTTVPVGSDGGFAVVGLDRIVRAAPRPLAQVRDQVAADIVADRRSRAARDAANRVVALVNRGASLADALRQAGVRGPAPQPLAATRSQLQAGRQVNPLLALMFSMKPGGARTIPSPTGDGWAVMKLDQVVPGDATKQPGVVMATRADLGRSIGQEYVQQFARAVAASVGVKRNQGNIDKLKKDLLGTGEQ
ncbi:peptidylprolyl isomerase [Sphingomonas corticis]|jgi:peptidyl-prolyl cis-trans isomerase D|uniref:Peptidylprolyl isomerase n=1 Tax=Sphingomonas corticis TaxID=2722791 RepID=A0ABX1CK42_9SPHN|nr:peptidylprolyl isomerase [Sphingomonas corticis]NJR78349.1 peptidylprolyl isomerase [Sphingomonas corticis]